MQLNVRESSQIAQTIQVSEFYEFALNDFESYKLFHPSQTRLFSAIEKRDSCLFTHSSHRDSLICLRSFVYGIYHGMTIIMKKPPFGRICARNFFQAANRKSKDFLRLCQVLGVPLTPDFSAVGLAYFAQAGAKIIPGRIRH